MTALWRLLDECACGDYRHQHGPGNGKEHGGPCNTCGRPRDMMNGTPCDQFRFNLRARDEPADAVRHPRRALR